MGRTKIKFCGMTRERDAEAATALGVDAIGLVVVPGSPRFLDVARATRIRRALPAFVTAVLLFKDADAAQVQEAIDSLRPDLLQFHGNEDPLFCASFGLPYMKAVSMQQRGGLAAAARAHRAAAALLLDSHAPGAMGGSGKAFAWKPPAKVRQPLVLAGGLTPDNVGRAIRTMKPYAVDVSSGIESKPGIKDARKMRAFVEAVRSTDARKS